MRNSTPVCMFKPRGWGSDGRAGGVCVDEGVYIIGIGIWLASCDINILIE